MHNTNPWNSIEATEYYFKKVGDEEKIKFSQPKKKIYFMKLIQLLNIWLYNQKKLDGRN